MTTARTSVRSPNRPAPSDRPESDPMLAPRADRRGPTWPIGWRPPTLTPNPKSGSVAQIQALAAGPPTGH